MEQSSLHGTQSAMERLEVLCSSEGKFNFFRHRIPLERPESILNGFKVLFSSALYFIVVVASSLQVKCNK